MKRQVLGGEVVVNDEGVIRDRTMRVRFTVKASVPSKAKSVAAEGLQ